MSTRFIDKYKIFDRTLGRLIAKLILRGNMPIDTNWQRTYAWERAHSNSLGLLECDPHSERVFHILEPKDIDEEESFRLWLDLAGEGSVYAMNEVAYAYESGRGVKQDFAAAERWYSNAFESGSQMALLRCAHRIASREDYGACVNLLQNSSHSEWPPALFWQAWYRLKQHDDSNTYQTVRPMLEAASEAGHPGAEWYLARLMAKGIYGAEARAPGRRRLMDIAAKVVSETDGSTES